MPAMNHNIIANILRFAYYFMMFCIITIPFVPYGTWKWLSANAVLAVFAALINKQNDNI